MPEKRCRAVSFGCMRHHSWGRIRWEEKRAESHWYCLFIIREDMSIALSTVLHSGCRGVRGAASSLLAVRESNRPAPLVLYLYRGSGQGRTRSHTEAAIPDR